MRTEATDYQVQPLLPPTGACMLQNSDPADHCLEVECMVKDNVKGVQCNTVTVSLPLTKHFAS